jgi:hypothetical protein
VVFAVLIKILSGISVYKYHKSLVTGRLVEEVVLRQEARGRKKAGD